MMLSGASSTGFPSTATKHEERVNLSGLSGVLNVKASVAGRYPRVPKERNRGAAQSGYVPFARR